MGQFHFDPVTYLDMVVAEVPTYLELQRQVADATRGLGARDILDLGVGTGETAAVVLPLHPRATLVGIDESAEMLEVARSRFPDASLRVSRLEDQLPGGAIRPRRLGPRRPSRRWAWHG